MLHGAAAADAEMRADRRDALRTRTLDLQEPAPVGMPCDLIDFDRLAGQRAGHVDRAGGTVGDAVAAMAQPGDQQPFNHAPPR